jgi:hypothetical protein
MSTTNDNFIKKVMKHREGVFTVRTILCGAFITGILVFGPGMLKDGEEKKKIEQEERYDELVGIYRCNEPGREVSLLERNYIVSTVGKYANQPELNIEWDPKAVVCTLDRSGELSLHIEKSQEDLVEAALRYTNDN